MCGIADDVESPESKPTEFQVEVSAESVDGLVKVLKHRFKSQAYLSKQLLGLSTGILYCTLVVALTKATSIWPFQCCMKKSIFFSVCNAE